MENRGTSCPGGGRGVLVIGAGVSGLTSALCLARAGFAVTVVADHFAPHITSVVAGALWEWPPAVCGHHHHADSLARSKAWCEIAYDNFLQLAGDPSTGVFLRPVTFYFKHALKDDERQRDKMEELRDKVKQFRHDPALIAEHGINPGLGLQDAYTHLAPMIDTDVYLCWLLHEVQRQGCRIVQRTIAGLLRDQEDALLREYSADVIVNCTGLGAKELADPSMYPLRGALIRVRNDGKSMPRITEAHCVARDALEDAPGFIFVVPRGDDTLLLGGLAEPGEWNLEIGLSNYEPIREMYRSCLEFMPMLQKAEIDAAEPVRVGLRPMRPDNVRVEWEAGTRTIHNYGHGGSGVTLSWGCALEVVQRVKDMEHSQAPG